MTRMWLITMLDQGLEGPIVREIVRSASLMVPCIA